MLLPSSKRLFPESWYTSNDGDLVFIDKDKPMLLPSSKRLVPRVVEYFKWDGPDHA